MVATITPLYIKDRYGLGNEISEASRMAGNNRFTMRPKRTKIESGGSLGRAAAGRAAPMHSRSRNAPSVLLNIHSPLRERSGARATGNPQKSRYFWLRGRPVLKE